MRFASGHAGAKNGPESEDSAPGCEIVRDRLPACGLWRRVGRVTVWGGSGQVMAAKRQLPVHYAAWTRGLGDPPPLLAL